MRVQFGCPMPGVWPESLSAGLYGRAWPALAKKSCVLRNSSIMLWMRSYMA